MVVRQADITQKAVSFRSATARGVIRLSSATISRVKRGAIEKGDPLEVARLTGVLAVKATSSMLALCHPLRIEHTLVDTRVLPGGIEVSVTVSAHEKTGVEMEALTGATIALLNIWDLVKPYEKDRNGQYPHTEITDLRVTRKVKRPIDASRKA